jgi:hypothetical protein
MLANFSHEEIVIPKVTVLGLAEETCPIAVASINDGITTSDTPNARQSLSVNSVTVDKQFRQFLDKVLGHLTGDERAALEPILVKYRNVFYDENRNEFKGTDLVEQRIITGDTPPIRKPGYRVPFALRKEMQDQVQSMLKKGIIRDSSSPWNFPAILVPKQSTDGKPKSRFCVDFRALNAATRFDTYPLPLFEETVSTLHGSKYFSVLDCYSGFLQIKLAEEDKPKTAFSTPRGHYEFNRLPYGLSNSPSSFQRLMDVVTKRTYGGRILCLYR